MKRNMLCHLFTLFLLILACLIGVQDIALAQDDLQAKVQNPVGSIYSLPFEGTFDFGAPDGTAFFLNVMPVIPVGIGNWNLINRFIAPVIYAPGLSSITLRFQQAAAYRERIASGLEILTIPHFSPLPLPGN